MRAWQGFLTFGLLCFGCSGPAGNATQGSGGAAGGLASGAAGSLGSGGVGIAKPTTSNVFVAQLVASQVGFLCLDRAILTTDDENGGPSQAIVCNLIEVQASNHCACAQAGRSPAPSALVPSVFKHLEQIQSCGDAAGQSKCDAANFCLCQINQETGEDLRTCVANQATATAGFCYIDDPTSSALRQCPAAQPRMLRFVEQGEAKIPAAGALLFIACVGSEVAP